jgi:hypothetical protein
MPSARVIGSGRPPTRRASALACAYNPAPLGAAEIDALVALGWLADCAVFDRDRVGAALASVFREMVQAKIL